MIQIKIKLVFLISLIVFIASYSILFAGIFHVISVNVTINLYSILLLLLLYVLDPYIYANLLIKNIQLNYYRFNFIHTTSFILSLLTTIFINPILGFLLYSITWNIKLKYHLKKSNIIFIVNILSVILFSFFNIFIFRIVETDNIMEKQFILFLLGTSILLEYIWVRPLLKTYKYLYDLYPIAGSIGVILISVIDVVINYPLKTITTHMIKNILR